MTKKDRTRLFAIRLLIDGRATIKDTARALDLSERQVKRLKAGVKEYGDAFVLHKNRGRDPRHTIPDETRELIVSLAKGKYKGANYTHLSELLAEYEDVVVSQSTVARILKLAGIKSPRKHKPAKTHPARARKAQEGLLVQMDASEFSWIKESVWSLHGAIDDATGKITGLAFYPTECLEGYFSVMRQMITSLGAPVAVYTDRHTIFHSPKNKKRTIEEELLGVPVARTQFSRACFELGISVIPAFSPQAKGRVERLWGTLHDRLALEMRIKGVDCLESANLFLSDFISRFNTRFSVQAEHDKTAYRATEANLDTVLCRKTLRSIDRGASFTHRGSKYQVVENGSALPIASHTRITVLESTAIGMQVQYGAKIYGVKPAPSIERGMPIRKREPQSLIIVPGKDHPWRDGFSTGLPNKDEDKFLVKTLFDSTCARL